MSEIKVGEKVLVSSGSPNYPHYELAVIERETTTQWILSKNRRFKKDGLRRVGEKFDMWSLRTELKPLTEENLEIYNDWRDGNRRSRIWSDIQNLKMPHHVSTDRLQEIYDELKGSASGAE